MRTALGAATLGLVSFISSGAFATEIPVNIGAGPAAFYVPEQLDEEDPKPFYGLRLHIKAIVNRELIQKNKGKVPEQYRKAVEKVDEARVGFILMPESIMLGTRKEPHGPEFYGATWAPLTVGLPVRMGPARLSLDAGLVFTYAYVNLGDYKIVDQTDEELKKVTDPDDIRYRSQVTHFFRPGGEIGLDLEIAFSESVLTSFGWGSAYYVPQELGGKFFSMGMDDLQKSLWRIHQAYAVFHYRIPVSVHM